LRPDFILVKDGKIAVGDAKYKEDYKDSWIKEDLQQVALYGRIKWEKIKKWIKDKYGVEEEINGDGQEPKLYIFYPVGETAKSDDKKQSDNKKVVQCPAESESFRDIYKVGVRVPFHPNNKP